MKKLNFGCGSIQPEGWDNVDIEDFGQQHIGSSGMFDANTYDMIVAHCTLQIVPWHDLVAQLEDLRRILKPGGVLRISLPDIVRGFDNYQQGDIRFFPNGEEDLDERFSAWLTWYSTTKTLLTQRALCKKLQEAGFSDFKVVDHIRSGFFEEPSEIVQLDTRQGECYFVEAKK